MTVFSQANTYSEGGYGQATPSRAGFIGTVAVHALLVGGYFLIPAEIIKTYVPRILTGTNVPLTPPPPENPVEKQVVQKPLQKPVESRPFVPDPVIDLSKPTETITTGDPSTTTGTSITEVIIPDAIDPPHTPVFTAVSIDPRYARNFQPDYPPAVQRAQEEGKVTVRIVIGADGRVISVEKLFATTEAFWIATRAQALSKWRFRAATRDGVGVESEKVMTVHFQLN